jgi:hypothetical protein
MLLFLYERPVLELLQTESLAEEIVRTLASADVPSDGARSPPRGIR